MHAHARFCPPPLASVVASRALLLLHARTHTGARCCPPSRVLMPSRSLLLHSRALLLPSRASAAVLTGERCCVTSVRTHTQTHACPCMHARTLWVGFWAAGLLGCLCYWAAGLLGCCAPCFPRKRCCIKCACLSHVHARFCPPSLTSVDASRALLLLHVRTYAHGHTLLPSLPSVAAFKLLLYSRALLLP